MSCMIRRKRSPESTFYCRRPCVTHLVSAKLVEALCRTTEIFMNTYICTPCDKQSKYGNTSLLIYTIYHFSYNIVNIKMQLMSLAYVLCLSLLG